MNDIKLCALTVGFAPECEDAAFAAGILKDEVERRTGLRLADAKAGEGGIDLCVSKTLAPAPEGYAYTAKGGRVSIAGYDRLGLIHGIGRLLRSADWAPGEFAVADETASTFPAQPIRGSQVGYRNKTNAYAAWTKDHYRQYIRDLALFGASAIEFLPPETDDLKSSPVMRYDPLELVTFTSKEAHDLGLSVWFWYPNMLDNRSGYRVPAEGFLPETDDAAKRLNEDIRAQDERRETDFAAIPYIDNILIPGGDPGSLEPEDLFTFSGRVAKILHKYHPDAGVWISAQVMKNADDFKYRFYAEAAKRPDWLTGVCHAPWVSHTMKECRERTPSVLPIRSYPDICHLLCCQYPVHAWDPIWAITAGRECYNPRPRWHRQMHRLTKPYNVGNLAYSEGIADDVSKFIWLDADWDESIPYMKTLRDYASMFISPRHADEIASVLALFEDIYEGPAVTNTAVAEVYAQLHALADVLRGEAHTAEFGVESYRFSMAMLMSAFYRYIQRRAIRDQQVYASVFDGLDAADDPDEFAASVTERLAVTDSTPDEALRTEVWALADVCWDKIRWKLSTSRHFSPDYSRGGFLDTMEIPLCNAWWLKANLKKLAGMGSKEEKFRFLRGLRDVKSAGPGGKYISVGEPESMRYLELPKTWWEEPEAITTPRIEQHVGMFDPAEVDDVSHELDKTRLERVSSILGYYHAPVAVNIDGLTPGAAYEVRIVYPMRFGWKGQTEIPTWPVVNGQTLQFLGCVEGDEWVYRYALPAGFVDGEGRLRLEIEKREGPRGSGITELWLIRK